MNYLTLGSSQISATTCPKQHHIPHDMNPHCYIPSSITNKMQCYAIFLITVNALHVSGGFSTHHELKTVHKAWSCQASLTHTRCCVYSFELLMMGGETAWNMYSIDSNTEYCITLHLVGYTWRNTLTMQHGHMNGKPHCYVSWIC
jgi:hypothetical protein